MMFCLLVALAILGFLLYFFFQSRKLPRKGKSVVISGCDSGFGHALAVHLANHGVNVHAGCYTNRGLQNVEGYALKNLTPCRVDLAEKESVIKMAENVKKLLVARQESGLWGLVNNAGFNDVNCPDDWLSIDNYKRVMNVNCYGHIRMTHAFKELVKAAEGRIVFVTSIRGRLVMPEAGPYTMSKYALEAYADTLRQDMYYFGVQVSIVEPGGFQTSMAEQEPQIAKNIAELWQNLPHELKRQYPYHTLASRVNGMTSDTRESRSSDLGPVVRALDHSLFAQRSRSRYIVGWDAWMVYYPVSFLDGRLADWLMRWWMAGGWARPKRLSMIIRHNS